MADKIRIAYAFNGDGLGHANRYLSVAPFLRGLGHDVVAFTGKDGLIAEPDAVEIPTICFKRDVEGRVIWSRTIADAVRQAWRAANSPIWYVLKDFDVVISDFEPIVYYVAMMQGKPRLAFDSQHFLSRGRLEVDGFMDHLKLRTLGMVCELATPCPNRVIVAKLTGDPDVRRRDVSIFNCVVRPELNGLKWQPGSRLLVHTDDAVIIDIILEANVPADVFTSVVRADTDHVKFYRKDVGEYTRRMPYCRGIISSAGSVTMAECAHVGIPLWVVKQPGDSEQRMNDSIAFRLGFRTGRPSVGSLKDFFASPFEYRAVKDGGSVEHSFFFNDAPAIAGVIDFWLREQVVPRR